MKLCFTEDLDGESALHLSQEVVNLLVPILINRGANGPDKAEDEPELHHPTQVFCVCSIYLEKGKESYSTVTPTQITIYMNGFRDALVIPHCWM